MVVGLGLEQGLELGLGTGSPSTPSHHCYGQWSLECAEVEEAEVVQRHSHRMMSADQPSVMMVWS